MSATQQIPTIEGQVREHLGSRHALRLRQAGNMPAVIYGHKQDPLHIHVDHKTMMDTLRINEHLVEVRVDGKNETCLVKEVQWDHLGTSILHLDLTRVDLNERVEVEVDIELVGEAAGIKDAGAFLEQPLTMMAIECLVTAIPESIKVDVSKLGVGDSISVGDIALPEGVTTSMDEGTVIVMVTVAAEEEVAAAVPAEGATAEPELIGRKLEEGEEAEGGAEEGKK